MNKEVFYLDVNRLACGLFVDLELGWSEHPFLFSKFRIKNSAEIKQIQSLSLDKVKIIPKKSNADALKALAAQKKQEEKSSTPQSSVSADTFWKRKKSSLEKAEQYRKEHRKSTQRYRENQKRISNLARNLKMAPANAIQDASEVIQNINELIGNEKNILVSMVNLSGSEFSIHHHALNVTVLALVLGKSLELSQEEMHQLGVGCILHDIGKVMLPQNIVLKKTPLTDAEAHVMKTHVNRGIRLVSLANNFPRPILEIIAHHHAYLDGTGYPNTTQASEVSQLARIVQIANQYDGLCNPINPAKEMSPKQAMASLFSDFDGKLDNHLIHRFVRNFGVYPPGTVVQLSDDSIAMVVAVDSENLLSPRVLIYNPDIPPNQALMLKLSEHPELAIVKALKRGEYPNRVSDYLGIEERLGYFIGPSS